MTVPAVPPSGPSPLSAPGLPPVNQALEPAWVRTGSASTQKAYASALAFEQVLVQQLSQSMTATSGLGGEGGESSEGSEAGSSEGSDAGSSGGAGMSAGSGQLSSLLPQALSGGVMSAGGLGLAAQLTRALEPLHGTAGTSAATGATSAASPSGGTAAGGGDAAALPSTGGTGGTEA
jgi:Rod binding domain-containing protein